MSTSNVKSSKRAERLVRQALAEFESSFYDSESVKHAYAQLDTIASAFRALYDDLFDEDDEASPDEVFEELGQHGLDKNASSIASALQKLASQQWYDDNRESEQNDIDYAERLREDLFALLHDFVDSRNSEGSTLPLFPSHEGGE